MLYTIVHNAAVLMNMKFAYAVYWY